MYIYHYLLTTPTSVSFSAAKDRSTIAPTTISVNERKKTKAKIKKTTQRTENLSNPQTPQQPQSQQEQQSIRGNKNRLNHNKIAMKFFLCQLEKYLCQLKKYLYKLKKYLCQLKK